MRTGKKISQAEAGGYINRREEFQASALRGVHGTYGPGRMSDDELRSYRQSNPTYTVLSYGTPIAWHGDAGWQLSSTKYSPTTSRHQSTVHRAIFNQGHDNARI